MRIYCIYFILTIITENTTIHSILVAINIFTKLYAIITSNIIYFYVFVTFVTYFFFYALITITVNICCIITFLTCILH